MPDSWGQVNSVSTTVACRPQLTHRRRSILPCKGAFQGGRLTLWTARILLLGADYPGGFLCQPHLVSPFQRDKGRPLPSSAVSISRSLTLTTSRLLTPGRSTVLNSPN